MIINNVSNKVYVIISSEFDYNDETYELYGSVLNGTMKSYKNLKEAKVALESEILEIAKEFTICSFGEWYYDLNILEEFSKLMTGENQAPMYNLDIPVTEFIEWCKTMGYEWIDAIPTFAQIIEIEI